MSFTRIRTTGLPLPNTWTYQLNSTIEALLQRSLTMSYVLRIEVIEQCPEISSLTCIGLYYLLSFSTTKTNDIVVFA